MRLSTAIRRAQSIVDTLMLLRAECVKGSIGWNAYVRDANAVATLANFASEKTYGHYGIKTKVSK